MRHAPEALVRQRGLQIDCVYEDQDDADTLRSHPLLKLSRGRAQGEGDLASQPTLSRLENAAASQACYRLAAALAQVDLRERERDGSPEHIVQNLGGTDDPAHGKQEGVAYSWSPPAWDDRE